VSEEKFLKCEKGGKCLSVEFRVFEKKRKVSGRKKNQSVLEERERKKKKLS
jgi:hypothetical protein